LTDVCTAMLEEDELGHSKLIRDSGGYGIASDVKEHKNDFERLGLKPQEILKYLREKTLNLPTLRTAANNYFKYLRSKKILLRV
jgi:hypothetical protein